MKIRLRLRKIDNSLMIAIPTQAVDDLIEDSAIVVRKQSK
jgi:hypothetical protein